ncbi:hypothetical protein V22_20190 [Calycomorphotria hydatis]|uniref:Uncharacterized protein n=1 Tax=Calycomorphotria hydatis TaxID=2528027 RepID=A0A517T8U7_9PLAN|nr:hypothetical protein V22_20190 [Calycomorphotria hydatis]
MQAHRAVIDDGSLAGQRLYYDLATDALMPYSALVSYTAVLNHFIWRMNVAQENLCQNYRPITKPDTPSSRIREVTSTRSMK